jgi:hypothetical protein
VPAPDFRSACPVHSAFWSVKRLTSASATYTIHTGNLTEAESPIDIPLTLLKSLVVISN